ncbi:hypothetical protein Q9L58_006665 [Maublancomyces gigas]|uniref:F-box domain-containing protein n=1 Tax=Discina gigas TaxID=1032678 RepID=A0ABR3GEM1_9PEZI
MAFLEYLPDELLLQTFSYLLPTDLNSASRVSRHINNITTPLLYNEPWLITSDQDPTDMHFFIRTLLTPGCESLATHVRHLHLDWISEPTPPSHSDDSLLKCAARRFGLGNRSMTESAQVILLLHLLPQLHTLNLFPPEECDEFHDFMESFTTPQPITIFPIAFQSLRKYDCQRDISDNFLWTMMLLNLMRLPHIEFIRIPACNGLYFGDLKALITAEASSTVTHLELTTARVTPAVLSIILKIPQRLTHFALYHCGGGMNHDFHALRSALDPLRSSLTSLVIHYQTNQTRVTHRSKPSITIGSLRDWPVLRSVKCSLLPILGKRLPGESREIASLLPACIHELEILNDHLWTMEEAVCVALVLVGQKQSMLQGLRRLAVYSGRGGDWEMRERLSNACVQAGVENVEDVDDCLFADE